MININQNRVEVIIDNSVLIEMFYIADEFVWILNSKEIIVNKDNDFYDKLDSIMKNNYVFQNGIPSKKDDKMLVWLSDQYCNIEDEEELDKINRLIIKRKDNCFVISVFNPFFEKFNINKSSYMISFSPLFNGFYSRNVNSGISLQDDFCLLYQELLNKKERVLK